MARKTRLINSEKNMNKFKLEREEFFRKYFPFPKDLEFSIKKSGPVAFDTYLCGENPTHSLAKYDKPERLFRILDLVGFDQHFNWRYLYKESYSISDWCHIYWQPDGNLWVHFEWLNIYPLNNSFPDVDMDDESWEFFYAKRKTILTSFCGGNFIKHFKEEDLAVILSKRPFSQPMIKKMGV